jgi:hypothetical protein
MSDKIPMVMNWLIRRLTKVICTENGQIRYSSMASQVDFAIEYS